MAHAYDLRSSDRAKRRRITIDATLIANGVRHDVEVHNISASGFEATLDASVPLGTLVQLATPSLETVPATVVRHLGRVYGFRFLSHLSPEKLAAVRPIDTITRFPQARPADIADGPGVADVIPKWSLRARFAFIVGSSILLWLAIIGLLLLAGSVI